MNIIIDFKKKHIERIERKATEMFGAIKINEDTYMIPSNKVCSTDIDDLYLKSEFFSDSKLIKEIRKLKFEENDFISITCKKIKKNNVKILELIKVTENEAEDCVIELKVKSNLSYEDREAILQMIANENRDKQIFINFYDYYNFNQLEELMNN